MYEELIAKEQAAIDAIVGKPTKIEIKKVEYSTDPNLYAIWVDRRIYGSTRWGMFPTSCAAMYVGYLEGITYRSAELKKSNLVVMYLLERIAVDQNYGLITFVSSRIPASTVKELRKRGYKFSKSFINPAHGENEAKRKESRVRLSYKVIDKDVFRKWGWPEAQIGETA